MPATWPGSRNRWRSSAAPKRACCRPDMDYGAIGGLRLEARQKLAAIRPLNIGQASRISGVSPADIAVLLIWLEQDKAADSRSGRRGE